MEFNETPETGKHAPPETIHIGESFRLFTPNRTKTEISSGDWGYKGYPIFDSRILLDTKGLLPKLPIVAHAFPAYKNKAQAFAPFFPDDGYQVTAEDFDAATRGNKKAEIVRDNMHDISSSPLLLGVYIERDEPDREIKLTSDELLFLKNLRLQVSFPNGLGFEAKSEDIRENGDTGFSHTFYPIDTGSLAPVPSLYEGGLQIALPAELEQLQHIEGMFLSAPHL